MLGFYAISSNPISSSGVAAAQLQTSTNVTSSVAADLTTQILFNSAAIVTATIIDAKLMPSINLFASITNILVLSTSSMRAKQPGDAARMVLAPSWSSRVRSAHSRRWM